MLAAVQALFELFDAPARRQAQFPFESQERFDWSYVPRERAGLPISAMNLDQRRALHALLRSALSTAGYLKATSIMQLEVVLRALETEGPIRDHERFSFTLFGAPSSLTPWGWRLEGHHLSLHFTGGADLHIATTPTFFGANPAEVRSGPHSGLRVLGAEEDLARQLLNMLDNAQRTQVIIATTAPRDIITTTDRQVSLTRREGMAVENMTPPQRNLLIELLKEYTNNLVPELADTQFARISTAGIDRLHFAWAGSSTRGEPHYYRIHGPTTLIEYDNTQNDANHIHTVWRDLEDDWGGDQLAQHYAESTHHHD